MRDYAVKEIHRTIQGEGAQAGRACVLVRLAGCNLWTGRAPDRPAATCRICDTDFVGTDGPGGGRYRADGLARRVAEVWDSAHRPLFVVLTGGEPMLQVDPPLVDVLHRWGCEVAVETNGTRPVPPSLDWIAVSPKPGAPLSQRIGQELKLVYPQPGADPADYADLDFRHFFLQPCDGPDRAANTRAAVEYCLARPRWRLSLQLHKFIGIP